jgi:hypothetical protein
MGEGEKTTEAGKSAMMVSITPEENSARSILPPVRTFDRYDVMSTIQPITLERCASVLVMPTIEVWIF